MTTYEIKQDLFHRYVNERNSTIFGNYFHPEGESYETADFYINNAKWINIFNEKQKIVGFIILEKDEFMNSAFFPDNIDADYYLIHAYVIPEFRNKGHFKRTILNYIEEHRGVYAIHLLQKEDVVSTIIDSVFLNNEMSVEFIGYSDSTDAFEDLEYIALYKVS